MISFWFHKSKTDSFCHCLIKRRCAVQEHTRNEPGWRNSSAGTSFGLRDLRGCGERRYACQRKRTELLQPAQGPGEQKQKEFLPGSLSRFPAFLAPPHLSLSPSHLVVVIHHGISKPFRASVQKWRLRIPWIIGFRVVPPSPLNLLDSLSPSSTGAWWRDKRNPCRQRKHDECLLKIHEITSFGFAFILFICLVNIRSHCCF